MIASVKMRKHEILVLAPVAVKSTIFWDVTS
jgi:hypothetical protein